MNKCVQNLALEEGGVRLESKEGRDWTDVTRRQTCVERERERETASEQARARARSAVDELNSFERKVLKGFQEVINTG
jgi:hypothetical protein